jgi:hypothetical protein
LRSELAKRVPTDQVEVAFEQVIKAVFERPKLSQGMMRQNLERAARWYAGALRKGRSPAELDSTLWLRLDALLPPDADVDAEVARVKEAAAKLA